MSRRSWAIRVSQPPRVTRTWGFLHNAPKRFNPGLRAKAGSVSIRISAIPERFELSPVAPAILRIDGPAPSRHGSRRS